MWTSAGAFIAGMLLAALLERKAIKRAAAVGIEIGRTLREVALTQRTHPGTGMYFESFEYPEARAFVVYKLTSQGWYVDDAGPDGRGLSLDPPDR